MRDSVREAEAFLALLSQGTAEPRIVFKFYCSVRDNDKALADRLLRQSTDFVGLYARNRRRLKEIDQWLAGTAPFYFPEAKSSSGN